MKPQTCQRFSEIVNVAPMPRSKIHAKSWIVTDLCLVIDTDPYFLPKSPLPHQARAITNQGKPSDGSLCIFGPSNQLISRMSSLNLQTKEFTQVRAHINAIKCQSQE